MKIIKKKENKRKTRLMLNIEKYKNIVMVTVVKDVENVFLNGYLKKQKNLS